MKYYGTLGPACANREILIQMMEAGMTGMRLNVSHTGLEKSRPWIEKLNEAEIATGKKMELLIDLQGPELRIGYLAKAMNLETDMIVEFVDRETGGDGCAGANELCDDGNNVTVIPVPQKVLQAMRAGQTVLIDDGKIRLHMESDTTAKVLRGGELTDRKSILIENVCVELDTLTAEDLENIALIKKYGVTGIMLPFVRGRQDIENLRTALKKAKAEDTRIFAKIENQRGVKALDEILPAADEIVIARGDLGNSCPLWELPVLQEQIGAKCREHNTDFMVVTQMLASMEKNPVPTRAEMTDIFLAVKQGAASIMLTGETASGNYPAQSMEYFVRAGEHALRSV